MFIYQITCELHTNFTYMYRFCCCCCCCFAFCCDAFCCYCYWCIYALGVIFSLLSKVFVFILFLDFEKSHKQTMFHGNCSIYHTNIKFILVFWYLCGFYSFHFGFCLFSTKWRLIIIINFSDSFVFSKFCIERKYITNIKICVDSNVLNCNKNLFDHAFT